MHSERALTLAAPAAETAFAQTSEQAVGELLAALAARVPPGGRILELGTGVGVGTAWLVEGVGDGNGVEIVTVDVDDQLVDRARSVPWPSTVRFVVGDALELLPSLGTFDLIFADAIAGKWYGLDLTIAALAPGAMLVVDDMAPPHWADAEHEQKTRHVREVLLGHPDLISAELKCSSGIVIATKRHARPSGPPSERETCVECGFEYRPHEAEKAGAAIVDGAVELANLVRDNPLGGSVEA